jgi:phosphatidate cytidylyltransferase
MLQRTISIVIGAPLFLLAVLWRSAWPCTLLIGALAILALVEFYAACRRAGSAPAAGFGCAAAMVILASSVPLLDPPGVTLSPGLFAGPASATLFFLGLTLLVASSLAAELARADRAPLRNLGPTWLGVLYIGWLLPFAARLRWLTGADLLRIGWPAPPEPGWLSAIEPGAWLLLFVLLVTWSVDTLAYLVGKAVGRHRMAAALSPGKTWEGAAGGFIGAVAVAGLLGWLLRFPAGWALAAGALIGVVAQIGDLCESAIKREIGIKDFGDLIPGHGGALDRFDSLLFNAPAVYFLLLLWPRA